MSIDDSQKFDSLIDKLETPTPAHVLKELSPQEQEMLISGVHAGLFRHAQLSQLAHSCRQLGLAQAAVDDRPNEDVVLVLAHNAESELFFKRWPVLTDEEKTKMRGLLSAEESIDYETLLETEKSEDIPTRVKARVARVEYERDWATARWCWARYFAAYFPNGEEWAMNWVYRDVLKVDPIYQEESNPHCVNWREMLTDAPKKGVAKCLVIFGNRSSVQMIAFADEIEPAEAPAQTADEYAASLR